MTTIQGPTITPRQFRERIHPDRSAIVEVTATGDTNPRRPEFLSGLPAGSPDAFTRAQQRGAELKGPLGVRGSDQHYFFGTVPSGDGVRSFALLGEGGVVRKLRKLMHEAPSKFLDIVKNPLAGNYPPVYNVAVSDQD